MRNNRLSLAQWMGHINHVHPPTALQNWLQDAASLTTKLIARSSHFRVQKLVQKNMPCLYDEFALLNLARPQRVITRQVLLHCDHQATIFAHTVAPIITTSTQWPLFRTLGEQSLGTILFGDQQVQRHALQYARLHPRHPLHRTISALVPIQDASLFARRCLYQRKGGPLLVTEVFLPNIYTLPA